MGNKMLKKQLTINKRYDSIVVEREEEDVCFKNRLMCEEKLKDAKKWIDKQIN